MTILGLTVLGVDIAIMTCLIVLGVGKATGVVVAIVTFLLL
jgi:hypothetical protein